MKGNRKQNLAKILVFHLQPTSIKFTIYSRVKTEIIWTFQDNLKEHISESGTEEQARA